LPPQNQATQAVHAAYSLAPARNTWPPLAEGASAPVQDYGVPNYYVVLDGSGSMNDQDCSGGVSKMDAAREALAAFAQSVPEHANLGLAAFDGTGISERLPLGTGNRDAFVQAVREVWADGGTPLAETIELAYAHLLEQGRVQLGYGEYHLVVVTDGIASPGQDPTQGIERILAESPVLLHTIGFCISDDHALNQPGRTYYRAADNPQALRKGLDEVLAEAPAFDVSQFTE
jgi:hypothetical protein